MSLGNINFLTDLSHHIRVCLSNDSCECCNNSLPPVAINDTSVDFFHEHLGIGNTFRYTSYDFFITLAVSIGNIVAQSDIASLQCGIQLGQFPVNLIVKVEDAPVILPKLLDSFRRYKTSTHQFLQHALCNPLSILYVTLVARQLLDEIGIDKLQLEMGFKDSPDGNPVDTCALHTNLLNVMFEHQITHFCQLEC